MKENWKDVKGYEGIYSVSDKGRVKRIRKNKELIMSLIDGSRGYKQVKFFKNGYKRFSVHRLVAEAFIPNPENKPEVNHKNKIRNDNRTHNLEWSTKKENIDHKINFEYYQKENDEKFRNIIIPKIMKIIPL